MKQLFFVSSPFQLVTLVAAIETELVPPAEERIVVIADNRIAFEVGEGFYTSPMSQLLLARFDRSMLLNDALRPFSCGQWSPREDDLFILERSFRSLWDLGDAELELYVESIQSPPATSFARIFRTAPITVYADGLMVYGPTRNSVSASIRQRLNRVLYLDLIPGLTPALLAETSSPAVSIDAQRFAAVLRALLPQLDPALSETTASTVDPGAEDSAGTADADLGRAAAAAGERPALIVGQYLSDIGLITVEEESDLYFRMVELARDRGFGQILFKRHPAASYAAESAVLNRCAAAGIDFEILDSPELVEITALRRVPGLVIGCFSTALMTLRTAFGMDVVSLGTAMMLEKVAPYQNSNRVPLVLIHRLLDVSSSNPVRPEELHGLLDAVTYCMQPTLRAELRDRAVDFLSLTPLNTVRIYFKRRRLTKLDLPGKLPPRTPAQGAVARTRDAARRVRGTVSAIGNVVSGRIGRLRRPR